MPSALWCHTPVSVTAGVGAASQKMLLQCPAPRKAGHLKEDALLILAPQARHLSTGSFSQLQCLQRRACVSRYEGQASNFAREQCRLMNRLVFESLPQHFLCLGYLYLNLCLSLRQSNQKPISGLWTQGTWLFGPIFNSPATHHSSPPPFSSAETISEMLKHLIPLLPK